VTKGDPARPERDALRAQLIEVTRLCKRESARNDRSYMVSRLASLRVLIFENADWKPDDPSHWLVIGEAQQRAGDGGNGAPAELSRQRGLVPEGKASRPAVREVR
jgi:hypothetical protein